MLLLLLLLLLLKELAFAGSVDKPDADIEQKINSVQKKIVDRSFQRLGLIWVPLVACLGALGAAGWGSSLGAGNDQHLI